MNNWINENKQVSCIRGFNNSYSYFTLQEGDLTCHSSVLTRHNDILPERTNKAGDNFIMKSPQPVSGWHWRWTTLIMCTLIQRDTNGTFYWNRLPNPDHSKPQSTQERNVQQPIKYLTGDFKTIKVTEDKCSPETTCLEKSTEVQHPNAAQALATETGQSGAIHNMDGAWTFMY